MSTLPKIESDNIYNTSNYFNKNKNLYKNNNLSNTRLLMSKTSAKADNVVFTSNLNIQKIKSIKSNLGTRFVSWIALSADYLFNGGKHAEGLRKIFNKKLNVIENKGKLIDTAKIFNREADIKDSQGLNDELNSIRPKPESNIKFIKEEVKPTRVETRKNDDGSVNESSYDLNDKLVKFVEKDEKGDIKNSIEYIYLTNEIKSIEKDANGIVKKSVEKYKNLDGSEKIFTFNAKNKLIKFVENDERGRSIGSFEYVRDEKGRLLKFITRDVKENIKGSSEYTYDVKGNTTKIIEKDKNDNLIKMYEYVYDEKGYVSAVYECNSKGDGLLKEYFYNKNGCITSVAEKDLNNNKIKISKYSTKHEETNANIED